MGGCGSSVFRLRMEFEGLPFVSCEKPGDGSFFCFFGEESVSCKCFSERKARRVLLKSIKVKEKRVFSGEGIAIGAE